MIRAIVLVTLVLASLPGLAQAAPGWTWPVQGRVITAFDYGGKRFESGAHRGIDIAAPVGTPVVAAAAGRVTFAGGAGDSGLTVAIDVARGRLSTSYLHLSGTTVSDGDVVAEGDRVGFTGVSGRPSSPRPHLHFGVRRTSRRDGYLDPLGFLGPLQGGAPAIPPLGPVARRAPVPPAPFVAPARPASAHTGTDPGPVVAGVALLLLSTCLGAPVPRRAVSSIARRWVTTSQRRSTT
ncbi:MAG: hypothetical protein QOG62_817 [Thermoleophilaceae bacterium]|jgi:murein DD-endopeptidase MepM/ murein hydrolase activator NlpD|nr:hypothetical protein [Thermoleophilaceae bacterium]